eukprot:1767921-Amphidinium_carterae.1
MIAVLTPKALFAAIYAVWQFQMNSLSISCCSSVRCQNTLGKDTAVIGREAVLPATWPSRLGNRHQWVSPARYQTNIDIMPQHISTLRRNTTVAVECSVPTQIITHYTPKPNFVT